MQIKTEMGHTVPELTDGGLENFFLPLIQAFGNDEVQSS